MKGVMRRVRRLGLWIAGAVSVSLGLAMVFAAVRPGRIHAVSTPDLLLMAGLVVLPALTVGLMRLDASRRQRLARSRRETEQDEPAQVRLRGITT